MLALHTGFDLTFALLLNLPSVSEGLLDRTGSSAGIAKRGDVGLEGHEGHFGGDPTLILNPFSKTCMHVPGFQVSGIPSQMTRFVYASCHEWLGMW